MRRLRAVAMMLVLVAAACSDADVAVVTTVDGGGSAAATATTALASDPGAAPTAPGASTPETTAPASVGTESTAPPDPGEGLRFYGELLVPDLLEGFTFGPLWLDGEELFVATAETSVQRQQGLMNVGDLGDLDGMIFVFEQDYSGGFWMKDTLLPLDIAFFDATGRFVDQLRMEPCTTEDCPTYRPAGPYRFALEMPAGAMPHNPQALAFAEPE